MSRLFQQVGAQVEVLTILRVGEQFSGVAAAVGPRRTLESVGVAPSAAAAPCGVLRPRTGARLQAEHQTGRASNQIRFAVGADEEPVANRRVRVREDAVHPRTVGRRIRRL